MNTKLPLAAAFLVTVALPAHAQVYKWVDAQGQVNYSNVPTRSEARIAKPVPDQISVVHPIDIKPAALAAAERRIAARLAQQDRDVGLLPQTLAVQPTDSQEVLANDVAVLPDVNGYATGTVGGRRDAYSRALARYYRQSLKPAPDAQANTSSQATTGGTTSGNTSGTTSGSTAGTTAGTSGTTAGATAGTTAR